MNKLCFVPFIKVERIPDPFSASYFLFRITLCFVLLYQGGQGLSTVKTSEINFNQNDVSLLFNDGGQQYVLTVDTATQNDVLASVKYFIVIN